MNPLVRFFAKKTTGQLTESMGYYGMKKILIKRLIYKS